MGGIMEQTAFNHSEGDALITDESGEMTMAPPREWPPSWRDQLAPYQMRVPRVWSRYTYPERWLNYVGQCYEQSYRYALAHRRTVPGLTVVVGWMHASRDPDGRIHHAWVELPGGVVFEGVHQKFYQRDAYYQILDLQTRERYSPDALEWTWGYRRP
jgi:hypothetical protein